MNLRAGELQRYNQEDHNEKGQGLHVLFTSSRVLSLPTAENSPCV